MQNLLKKAIISIFRKKNSFLMDNKLDQNNKREQVVMLNESQTKRSGYNVFFCKRRTHHQGKYLCKMHERFGTPLIK